MTDSLPSPRLEFREITGNWVLYTSHSRTTVEEMLDLINELQTKFPALWELFPLRLREDREGSSHKVYGDPDDKSPYEGGYDPLVKSGIV